MRIKSQPKSVHFLTNIMAGFSFTCFLLGDFESLYLEYIYLTRMKLVNGSVGQSLVLARESMKMVRKHRCFHIMYLDDHNNPPPPQLFLKIRGGGGCQFIVQVSLYSVMGSPECIGPTWLGIGNLQTHFQFIQKLQREVQCPIGICEGQPPPPPKKKKAMLFL